MKTCSRCRRDLPESSFSWRNKAKGTLQAYCKECNRAANKEHYQANKDTYLAKAKVSRDGVRIKKVQYLQTHPCVDCGESDFRCLDFDHVDPLTKDHNVSQMIRDGWSWETMEIEIAKCEVRCANCHRKRTATENDYYAFMRV